MIEPWWSIGSPSWADALAGARLVQGGMQQLEGFLKEERIRTVLAELSPQELAMLVLAAGKIHATLQQIAAPPEAVVKRSPDW